MKRCRNLILIFIIMLTMFSCGPKKLSVSYSNTCFNADNEIVYLKTHSYKYFNLGMMDDGVSFDTHEYICKMNLNGNEEVVDEVSISVVRMSEGNGKICIQTGGYDAYTYIDGEFAQVLEGVKRSVISFDGENISFTERGSDRIYVSDVNGENETSYVQGYVEHWHPDNQHVIYNWQGDYYLLDTVTSNTQSIPYRYFWSHDLQKITYFDWDVNKLVIMNADETGKITTDWDEPAIWSYDGEYLLSGFHLLGKNGNYIRTLRETD